MIGKYCLKKFTCAVYPIGIYKNCKHTASTLKSLCLLVLPFKEGVYVYTNQSNIHVFENS